MNPQHPSDAAPSPIPPSPSHLARAKTDGRGGHGGAAPEGAGPTARVGYGPSLLVLSKLPCGGDHFPGQSGGQGNRQGRGGKHSGTAQRAGHGHCSGARAASDHPMNLPRELWGSVHPSVPSAARSLRGWPDTLLLPFPHGFALTWCSISLFFAFFRPCLFYPNFWLVCSPTSLILFLLLSYFPPPSTPSAAQLSSLSPVLALIVFSLWS